MISRTPSVIGYDKLSGKKLLINNKLASDNLYEQRRKLGLCFKCGEKFTPGHRCVTKD